MQYDVFISHASEDKDGLVRPLVERLRESRIEVWYDEFTLRPGESLRRSIDAGLARSRFGIVVLSPSFFAKGWPQWELDGLVNRQVSGGTTVLIPIWHGVGHQEVAAYSPPLADKVAIPSSLGLDEVSRRILQVVHPEGSTLLIARDTLIDNGWEPPVVTDDWWLDVLEQSHERSFARLCFSLPYNLESPRGRGKTLAWAAMQQLWQDRADQDPITQLTHPIQALRFIDEQPGMREICEGQPATLLYFLPQLGVPGFGGYLEAAFDRALADSEMKHRSYGPLTTTLCDKELALHHPTFGAWTPRAIGCAFGQGPGGGLGPSAAFYDPIDYAVWFLSAKSDWLPRPHHAFLLDGMKSWAVWPWMQGVRNYSGFETEPETGALCDLLDDWHQRRRPHSAFELTENAKIDILARLSFSATILDLPESGEQLTRRFIGAGFIDAWFDQRRRAEARRRAGGRTARSRAEGEAARQRAKRAGRPK